MSASRPDHPHSNGHAGPSSPLRTKPTHASEPSGLSPTMTRRTSLDPVRSNLSRIRSSHQTSSSQSEDPELPRPPRPPSPTPPEDNAPPPAEEVTALRLSAHYSSLVLASMLGTLIRLGLEGLATYDGMVIYSLAWAQGVGCVIMGLALARKNEIIDIYPPLYTFLTTGIAGSVTTFSSWMLESYLAFSNSNNYHRKGLHDTVDGLGYSFSTFAISLACIHLGSHISSFTPPLPVPTRLPISDSKEIPTPPPRRRLLNPVTGQTPLLDILTISTAFLSYLIAFLLYFFAPYSWHHKATLPILLAPPGAILRFYLARLNPRPIFLDRFPLGTFLANMIATLIISGVFAAQRRPSAVGNRTTCNALYAIQQGFCGCLSTVSTFVVEARAIKRARWKWIYILGSVVLGHLFVLAIVGGVRWQEGYLDVCTG